MQRRYRTKTYCCEDNLEAVASLLDLLTHRGGNTSKFVTFAPRLWDRECKRICVIIAKIRKEVTEMGTYKLIVRSQLIMGRPVTDDDRKALDCYYETPDFYANSGFENVEIVDAAYELFCEGKQEFRCTESVELVRIA